ncbi:MAG: V-type ATP synthase subunit E [Candidatus Woesearchaeota archaeon]|nr:V-type ATP synthase subunit E [Candidatus Woesearchaeota archaeon]
MNTHDLVDKIIKDAERQAHEIQEKTNAKVSSIEEETQQQLQKRRAELYEQVAQEEQQSIDRATAQQTRDANLALLQCKHALVDDVFAESEKKLGKLPKTARTTLLNKLWKKVTARMKVTGVCVAQCDKSFFAKKKLKTATASGLGGFIATNGNGVYLDYRFETLLAQVKEERREVIAKVLFT